jgi:hypothetical protein
MTPLLSSRPNAMPVRPSRVAALSVMVTPGIPAAALYNAARKSAGTTPVPDGLAVGAHTGYCAIRREEFTPVRKLTLGRDDLSRPGLGLDPELFLAGVTIVRRSRESDALALSALRLQQLESVLRGVQHRFPDRGPGQHLLARISVRVLSTDWVTTLESVFASWENVFMPTTTVLHLEVPDLAGVAGVSDGELIETMRAWAQTRRMVDAGLATLAGEVAARSTLELGYDGLAQRAGARTADALVSQLTGTTGVEARSLTTVGVMLASPQPWLAAVAGQVSSGELSVGAAAAIQTGLGSPSPSVAADDLADAAAALLTTAGGLPPEKVARRARELRDELDENGVADREAHLRDKRFLRLIPQPDGMTRLFGLLDPESAALVTDAVDAVTSPRRGGPRFVDPAAAARADAIIEDTRSTEQLTLDALVAMVRIAAAADTGRVFGVRKPAVRVHVTLSDLDRRAGTAHLEGQTAAVSTATAERIACTDGLVPILFNNHGAPLKLGHTRRHFTQHQRTILAAIWGGCAAPGCERPPSWTEAHHINEWHKDHGSTNIQDGILLCKHHHLMVHNNHWKIDRSGTHYELVPPPGDRLHPKPIALTPKNPVHRREAPRVFCRSYAGCGSRLRVA